MVYHSFLANNASTADPLFANLSNNDFTLQATSPAINAGNNNFAFGTTDILGLQRIANNVVDLGAYEFGSSPLNTTNFDISKATLYPNPTNQFINITIENQNVKKVNIFSMQGKKVLQSEKGKVNIQQLQTGVYLIKIETNEGGQFISKFIKK